MSEIKDEKPTCNNCKHFFRHYVKHPTAFYQMRYGHCGKRKIKRVFMPEEIAECKFWEPAENKAEKSKKTIKSLLEQIETSLQGVKDILTCTDEYE